MSNYPKNNHIIHAINLFHNYLLLLHAHRTIIQIVSIGERPERESETKGYVMINGLRPYDRDWTIKAIVLRRGLAEPYMQ